MTLFLVLGPFLSRVWREQCHTVFVLDDPTRIEPVAERIHASGADIFEIWHGGIQGWMTVDKVIAEYATSARRITGFRLSRIVLRGSLGPLADDVVYELRVRPWANVGAPAVSLDPPSETSAPC